MTHDQVQTQRCQAVIASGIAQLLSEDDDSYVRGRQFDFHCHLLGLSSAATFRIRIAFLLGLIERDRLQPRSMNAPRHGTRSLRHAAEEGDWQTWGRQ